MGNVKDSNERKIWDLNQRDKKTKIQEYQETKKKQKTKRQKYKETRKLKDKEAIKLG